MLRSLILVSAILLIAYSQVSPSVNANNRYSASGTVTVVSALNTNWTTLHFSVTYPNVAATTTQRTGVLTINNLDVNPATGGWIDFEGQLTQTSQSFFVVSADTTMGNNFAML